MRHGDLKYSILTHQHTEAKSFPLKNEEPSRNPTTCFAEPLLMYEIQTEDFFEDIREDIKEKFDTSNFENSELPRLNKKVPGMFKDEAGGKIISEFVGLRAFDMDGDEFKKCKGVKKYVVNKEITLNDYKNCLFSGRQQLRPMNVIRSHHHEVFTEQVNKIALSADDDKRIIILPNRINTFAHDHFTTTTVHDV